MSNLKKERQEKFIFHVGYRVPLSGIFSLSLGLSMLEYIYKNKGDTMANDGKKGQKNKMFYF